VAWLLIGPLPGALSADMRAVAALAAAMAILWVSEAVPLAATALLPLIALPAAGVATASQAAGAFANDLVFLFLGGFVLANGVERSGVHRRLALAVRRAVGSSQAALVGGMMAATAFVSLWISNTAAALLMMPVALAVAAPGGPAATHFRTAMAIGVALAASIGGMGTPIGSTPNLLLATTMAEVHHVRLGFGWWLAWGLPLVVVLTAAAWALLVGVFHPLRGARVPGSAEELAAEQAAIGPWSREERLVALTFAGAIAAWIGREPVLEAWMPGLTDGMIAIAAALALFGIPLAWRPLRFALDWETGGKLPWDVILLLGGGLSLAEGIARTGLDRVLVQGLGGAADQPGWALALGLMLAGVLLSEVASNTAAAALLLPIAAALATARGLDPLVLMLPVTLAASLGYMLPAATPPNALALGTGHVRPGELARVGALMDLLGMVAIMLASYGLAFPLLRR
jgi:sodium-dependent dicarboxylate transporter 2/3/5